MKKGICEGADAWVWFHMISGKFGFKGILNRVLNALVFKFALFDPMCF